MACCCGVSNVCNCSSFGTPPCTFAAPSEFSVVITNAPTPATDIFGNPVITNINGTWRLFFSTTATAGINYRSVTIDRGEHVVQLTMHCVNDGGNLKYYYTVRGLVWGLIVPGGAGLVTMFPSSLVGGQPTTLLDATQPCQGQLVNVNALNARQSFSASVQCVGNPLP
jgi:hypothetical protein